MRKISIYIYVGCFVVFLLSLLSYAEQSQNFLVIKDERGQSVCFYGASHALLIGISNYISGWPALESIPAELEELETVLKQHGFYVVEHVDLKSHDLETAFKEFIDRNGFDKDNRLLFFFAGHGHTLNGNGYLVPADAPDPRFDEKTFLRRALSMDQILTWARRIEAKHALFLFDSCFSGTIFTTKALSDYPPPLTHTTDLPVRQFITGGGAQDVLPSKSVFTPAFIDALRFGWGDVNQDGYVTGTELGLYLKSKVPIYADQTPQFARINEYDLARGDFVFVAGAGKPVSVLTVLSNVDNNTVFIDGEIYGSTRVEKELPLGTHTVRVEKEGYLPFETSINLQEAQTLYVALESYADIEQVPPAARSLTSSDTWIEPVTGMEFVRIPGGCYQMGCGPENVECDFNEKPAHNVCVNDFRMGKYEVTQEQWQQIMGYNPSRFKGALTHPVENVSYDEVQEFIIMLNRQEGTGAYRLPTEAEWEYVARAGSHTPYWFGNDERSLRRYAWYSKNSHNTTHSVGQLKPNPYDVYDLYGNVWEWCLDRYDNEYYAMSSSDNPRGPLLGEDRVARGCSWNYTGRYCRSGYRFHYPPIYRNSDLGFRLVRDME